MKFKITDCFGILCTLTTFNVILSQEPTDLNVNALKIMVGHYHKGTNHSSNA